MATCKGRKKDGTPCRCPVVLDNGYCPAHQGQAKQQVPNASARWTREQLQAAVTAHGGPEGLNLAGAPLWWVDLSGIDLHGAILRRASLYRANLRGAKLSGVDLCGAELSYAQLQQADLSSSDLRGARLHNANLEQADLRANLQRALLSAACLRRARLLGADLRGADLTAAELQGADLMSADLREASLRGADLQGASLVNAVCVGVDLLDVTENGLYGVRLYRARLDRTLMRRQQLGTAIGDERAREYGEARDAYLRLKQNFESLGDYEATSWAYIRERKMERACSAPWRARRFHGQEQLGDLEDRRLPLWHPRTWQFYLRHTLKWASDWFIWLICDYGEGPWRTAFSIVAVLLGFAAFYSCAGLVDWVFEGPECTTVLVRTQNLWTAMVFSLGAMTTVGVPWLQPHAPWVGAAMAIEALLGIGLTGLLGFVLGNRIRRS